MSVCSGISRKQVVPNAESVEVVCWKPVAINERKAGVGGSARYFWACSSRFNPSMTVERAAELAVAFLAKGLTAPRVDLSGRWLRSFRKQTAQQKSSTTNSFMKQSKYWRFGYRVGEGCGLEKPPINRSSAGREIKSRETVRESNEAEEALERDSVSPISYGCSGFGRWMKEASSYSTLLAESVRGRRGWHAVAYLRPESIRSTLSATIKSREKYTYDNVVRFRSGV